MKTIHIKRYIVIFLILFFSQGNAFTGSFYTATLFPKEKTNDVKEILKNRKFFICSKNENYNLVTEEKMNEQNQMLIRNFSKKISQKTADPVISYMIFDSDVLWFVIYKNGKEIFTLDNSQEYFCGGKFVQKEKKNIAELFKIDADEWVDSINEAKFHECMFADDFLMELIKILKLPEWVEGIGFSYLLEDENFKSDLQDDGIQIEQFY